MARRISADLELKKLAQTAKGCEACPLYKYATQTVFGEGSAQAKIMLIGEQPGDVEDRTGKPFAGPAGAVLDKALQAAGLKRSDVYVTNAVKHFKFEQVGNKRLHKQPRILETKACFHWLEEEIVTIQPAIIVCLGATAAKVIAGNKVKIAKDRGKFIISPWAEKVILTYHPSAILRAIDHNDREKLLKFLITDLKKAARAVKSIKVIAPKHQLLKHA